MLFADSTYRCKMILPSSAKSKNKSKAKKSKKVCSPTLSLRKI